MKLSNQLNAIKLARTTKGGLLIDTYSSVVRAEKLPDPSTFLYRFQIAIQTNNISAATVFIPAMVVEFFIGTMTGDLLKPGQGFLVNQPVSFLEQDQGGSIKWTRLAAAVQSVPEIDDHEIAEQIKTFSPTAGQFVGFLDSGGAAHWNADFVLCASPKDMGGAVITFWEKSRSDSDPFAIYKHARTELLSEAEDALSLKTQSAPTLTNSPNVPPRTN